MANQQLFTTTHWSLVLDAAQQVPSSSAALAELCRIYWYPLYAHVRARGYSPEDAEDLTQEFFARLLANRGLCTVSPSKGKFRCFLLASINHLLSDERDRARRLKRGGGQAVLSFDAQSAEERYRLEPADELTPEKIFHYRWAVTLVEECVKRLEAEYFKAGKTELFEALHDFLTGSGVGPDYPAVARRLGVSEGAARVAVHRLRKRFGSLFRQTVAATLDPTENLEEEIGQILAILRG